MKQTTAHRPLWLKDDDYLTFQVYDEDSAYVIGMRISGQDVLNKRDRHLLVQKYDFTTKEWKDLWTSNTIPDDDTLVFVDEDGVSHPYDETRPDLWRGESFRYDDYLIRETWDHLQATFLPTLHRLMAVEVL